MRLAMSQATWERQWTDNLPASVARLVLARHAELIETGESVPGIRHVGSSPLYVPNVWLAQQGEELKVAHVTQAFDEQAIRDHAENYARLCSRMQSLESRQSFALYLGIEPPAGKSITPLGAVARLDDPLWWRRQLRKRWTRSAENAMRDLGIVRKGREPYASEQAVRHRGAQKRRMRAFLGDHAAVNELGEQLPLLEVAEKSLANPAIRRGEFMTRVRGFEEIARDMGHVAEFVTLTAPSFFHAQLAKGGRNPLFERAIVRDAQGWLCKMWARARAKLKRLSILFYGFRIAEPHHDATPHWHLLLFVPAHAVGALRAVLTGFWLSDHASERGAAEHRAKFETIDPARGSAAGYIAKYVSKNIDGAGEIGIAEDSETGARVADGIERVDAWASIHGIRQFQQIGGPPVGLWRELRRIRKPVDDNEIEVARLAAEARSFAGMVRAVGGIGAGRCTTVRVWKEHLGTVSRYGDVQGAVPAGIMRGAFHVRTRSHVWRIVRAGCGTGRNSATQAVDSASPASLFSSLGPVAITVRGAAGLNEPAGWSNPNETSQAGPL